MAYPLSRALADPAAAARHLLSSEDIFGVQQASGRAGPGGAAILELTLHPLPALHHDGYPDERVRLIVRADLTVHAFPLASAGRRFKHRNPAPVRDLCLQYPHDDPALRWIPGDGLEALITLVHRHLIYEEAWRRTNVWPAEDAPHGEPPGDSHPVRSLALQHEARRWAR